MTPAEAADTPVVDLSAWRVDAELEARIALARTLVAYDIVAWETSDAVQAAGATDGLGRSWFVVDAGAGPTGYYGRYDVATEHFVQAVAFPMDTDRTTHPVTDVLPAAVADPRARAIGATWAHGLPRSLTRLATYGVHPNLYALESATGLDVWFLPGLAPDGQLVTATCGVVHYDADGRRRLGASVERRKPGVYPIGPDQEATLPSVSPHNPTTCEVFWAFYYADDFARLTVHTRDAELYFVDVPGVGRVPVVVAE